MPLADAHDAALDLAALAEMLSQELGNRLDHDTESDGPDIAALARLLAERLAAHRDRLGALADSPVIVGNVATPHVRSSSMKTALPTKHSWLPLGAALILAVTSFGSFGSIAAAADVKVTLAGDQEVPSVTSPGTGTGTITVDADKSVHGSVTTKGIAGTAAHIHVAAPGKNGPVVIPLEKQGDTYTVPAGAKLTDEQFASFQAGHLYVNVHTAAHPDGEIRGQLKP